MRGIPEFSSREKGDRSMVRVVSGEEALRELFSALTESCFQTELGVADPEMTDYLSDMLTRFSVTESLYPVRDPRGRRLKDLVGLLEEAQQREAGMRREIYRHIGDFTLFWSGVYPESVTKENRDALLDFFEQGRRSYFIASTYESEEYEREAPVLRRLSAEFELCTVGLRMVRTEWERMGEHPEVRRDCA